MKTLSSGVGAIDERGPPREQQCKYSAVAKRLEVRPGLRSLVRACEPLTVSGSLCLTLIGLMLRLRDIAVWDRVWQVGFMFCFMTAFMI